MNSSFKGRNPVMTISSLNQDAKPNSKKPLKKSGRTNHKIQDPAIPFPQNTILPN